MRHSKPTSNRQRGSVAVIVGVSLVVLIGFAGLVLDLGRLFINKTELQTAADSCALAAASQLACDPGVAGDCTAATLTNAENAGIFAAGTNRRDMQAHAVVIAPEDVKFSTVFAPNSAYVTRAGASPISKYVMCTSRSTGIVPWFIRILGIGASDVVAGAVATLAPAQGFCSSAPLGLCKQTGSVAPSWGYKVGDWVGANFNSGKAGDGLDTLPGVTTGAGFKWVDFTPSAGGVDEVRDQLAGNGVCGLHVGDNIEEPGVGHGAKDAYNTRFGIYPKGGGPSAYTLLNAPPDKTGYAYPNKAPGSPVIGIGTSAYADYSRRQGTYDPFDDSQYDSKSTGGKVSGSPSSTADHRAYGSDRRLVAIPVVDCSTVKTTMVGMACMLMLNPMANGTNGAVYLEYRGQANQPGTPCATSGTPGGTGGSGPLVPTLVQ